MKKPSIPDVPHNTAPALRPMLDALKVRAEIIGGERGSRIELLDSAATDAEVIAKVNELLTLLQRG